MAEVREPVFAVSALTLVPGAIGGSERYTRELLRALSDSPFADRVRVIAPPAAPELTARLQGTVVQDYGNPNTTAARAAAMARFWRLRRHDARRILREEIAGIHYPLTTQVPTARNVPSISSVHDVQHLIQPEHFTRAERAYRAIFYGAAIRHAALIITFSKHAADALHETCGVPRNRIRVIHHGIDTKRFTFDETIERRDFLLYPAAPWPHKNHDRLFQAFRILRAREPELELVLTGAGTERLPPEPGVRALGRITDEELAQLYRTARALVFPSLYEGFGMPVIEALASGCPVACSRTTSLPEVAGTFATYFDPTDIEEMAGAIERCASSATSHSAQAGRAHAERFSWSRTAELHVSAYEEILD